jgi:energy-coupling factor transporter ATP-binding protein EcfA2
MENTFIQKFEIFDLFGYKDVSIIFNYSTLIVIGENGFGKTSILNALNFLITHSYKRLLEIKFSALRIVIDGADFFLERSLIEKYVSYVERRDNDEHSIIDFVKRHTDKKVFLNAVDLLNQGKRKEFYSFVNNDDFLKTIPANVLYQELFTWNEQTKAFNNFLVMENLIDSYGYDVLFYPTYRRVEVDYQSLFPQEQRHRLMRFEEDRNFENQDMNIRFGMRDVARRIETITDIIRKSSLEGFTNVSGDMIHQMLDMNSGTKHELDCTLDELRIVLDRTGSRLDVNDKNVILDQFANQNPTLFKNDFLLFYLQQLLMIYRSQEKYDSAINRYCDVCNKYLNEKKFVYDASNVTLGIYRSVNGKPMVSDDYRVRLNQLSSGEKQIVSIFSQIYLELDKKYVVLFDEPELSLSIYWQENLLPDIIASGNCMFLMAVTHSPFIFGDTLKKYTVGMHEFIKR